MRSFLRPYPVVWTIVVLGLIPTPALADRCHLTQLDRPVSASSLFAPTWVDHRTEVLALDENDPRTIAITRSGQRASSTPLWKTGDPSQGKPSRPLGFARAGEQYLLILRESRVLRLNSRFEERGVIDLTTPSDDSPFRIADGSLYDWAMVGNESLFFFGAAFDQSTGQVVVGYFRHRLPRTGQSQGGSTELVLNLPDGEEYHALGYRYIAAIGQDAYFLALDGAERSIKLYRHGLAQNDDNAGLNGAFVREELLTFDYELPVISNHTTKTEIRRFKAETLGRDFPRGLLSMGGLLYIPHRDEQSRWSIQQLPQNLNLAKADNYEPVNLTLPGPQAVEVEILPTPSEWLFFLGSDKESGLYDRLMRLPAWWIEQGTPDSSPLATPKRAAQERCRN